MFLKFVDFYIGFKYYALSVAFRHYFSFAKVLASNFGFD